MKAQTGPVMTDAELVERCRAHDEEAWSLLIDRYGPYIYAIALRGFGLSQAQAEEVFQETVLSLFKTLSTLQDPRSLKAWIGRIAANAVRQHLRRHGGRAGRTETALDENAPDEAQEAALARVEEAFLVREAMAGLPEDCRKVLTLFFYEQRKYADIAAALGIAEGTVASRIARCLVRLRGSIAKEP
jgi:RNA polymerase sigma-70 factor (ECF subfamily)